MGSNLKRMKQAIAEAREKNKEPKPAKNRCCNSGWSDVHTANCHKLKGAKRAKQG
jgi:hypothetical protein